MCDVLRSENGSAVAILNPIKAFFLIHVTLKNYGDYVVLLNVLLCCDVQYLPYSVRLLFQFKSLNLLKSADIRQYKKRSLNKISL